MHGNGIGPRVSQEGGPLNESQCTRARGLKARDEYKLRGASLGKGVGLRGEVHSQPQSIHPPPPPDLPCWARDIREQAAYLSINKT